MVDLTAIDTYNRGQIINYKPYNLFPLFFFFCLFTLFQFPPLFRGKVGKDRTGNAVYGLETEVESLRDGSPLRLAATVADWTVRTDMLGEVGPLILRGFLE